MPSTLSIRPAAAAFFVAVAHLAPVGLAQTPLPPGVVLAEFVFETAPFKQCHASTVCETPAGIVAAWFAGTKEGAADVGIWFARLQGGRWSAPVEVANGVYSPEIRRPTWNPVLWQQPGGPLVLFYKVSPKGKGGGPSQWLGMVTTSTDGGQTWERPRSLPPGILGPVKNKPLLLPGGELLCPSSSEHDGWRVHFEFTRDLRAWRTVGPVNDGKQIEAIQPSVLTHRDGRLQAIGRTRQGKIFSIESADKGQTWGPMTLLDLPNPNSGTDAVTLADRRHLLVYNPTGLIAGKWGGKRTPLCVALSRDGKAWQAAAVLENEAGEYSYPAVIEAADRRVHITYTWKRQRIKHVVLDPAQLVTRPMVEGEWPLEPLALGAAAPDFALPGVDGKTHRLADFAAAKVLAVIFTCNHCPTAQAYEARIKKLAADYRGRGVAVVAISPNDPKAVRLDELGYTDVGDSLADMKLRAKEQDFNFPYLYDGDRQEVSRAYGPAATPHAFVFDAERKLRYLGRIDDADRPERVKSHDLRNAVEALLAGRPVPVERTRPVGCSTKWASKRGSVAESLARWANEAVTLEPIDERGVRALVKNDGPKLRLINVWATWCGPCVAELDELVTIHRMYRGREFEVATLSANAPAEKPKALALLKEKQASTANYLFAGDDKQRLLDLVDKHADGSLPLTLLVAPGGEVLYRQSGPFDSLSLRRAIVGHLGRTYK